MKLFDTEGLPRSEPMPMSHVPDDARQPPTDVDPHEIAYWVHCQFGMSPLAFMAWLVGELDHLDGIDPECSK